MQKVIFIFKGDFLGFRAKINVFLSFQTEGTYPPY